MFVWTSNIKDNPDMPAAHVRHDFHAVGMWTRKFSGRWGVWQEIDHEDVPALEASFPERGWYRRGRYGECPHTIAKAAWVLDEFETFLMHLSKPHVSPRRITTRGLAHRRFSKRRQVAGLGKHTVSGAFSHPGQDAEEWRREMWAVDKDHTEQIMLDDIANGISGFIAGDLNRKGHDWSYDVPGFRWIAHSGFDHIGVYEAPEGVRFKHRDTLVLPTSRLYTDHAALGAVMDIIVP